MFFIKIGNGGRFGNAVFNYLAARLIALLYDAVLIHHDDDDIRDMSFTEFGDDSFIEWMNNYLNTGTLLPINNNIIMNGYYIHDTIYIKNINILTNYITLHPDETFGTFANNKRISTYYLKDLLGNAPITNYNYNTVIHLRIEDFLTNDRGIHPYSIDNVLKNCKPPFIFVFKPIETELDNKYINYFKNKYPEAYFYDDNNVINAFNLMRNSKYLVCPSSSLSLAAAILNHTDSTIFIPLNPYPQYNFITIQYPNTSTKIYEWKCITQQEINML